MAKNVKLRKISPKFTIILSIMVFFVLSAMTIGFARYNRILNLSGNVALQPQGDIYISNVVFTGGQNVTSNPTFSGTSVDFGLHFSSTQETPSYTANFDVTITNETFYNQVFAMEYWQPTITKAGGTSTDEEEAFIEYTLDGIKNGDTIATGASVTFSVHITMHAGSGDYDVNGEAGTNFTNTSSGTLLAQVLAPTTGDLRQGNIQAAFTVHVSNSYDYVQNFNLELRNNVHFVLTDSNGASLGSQEVPANSERDFVVYVRQAEGAEFFTDYERANIYLSSASLGDVNCGRITLLVDRTASQTDEDPPIISSVEVEPLDASGEAKVTWTATDDVTISHFTVQVYDSEDQLVKTVTTSDDTTSAVITGLSDGQYYVKVYGEDSLGNAASQSEIDSATTDSGHCSRSAITTLAWTFSVTWHLSRLTTNGANTAQRGASYTAKITPSSYYSLPDRITVKMGSTTLKSDAYTYNRNNGTITIPNVSDNLDITATGKFSGCLIEGTDILLYDGTTKKVEDIRYDDLLAVWNYETGQLDAAYPIWIEREHKTQEYQWAHFSDGSDLYTTFDHGALNADLNQFIPVHDARLFRPGTKYYKTDSTGELKTVTLQSVATMHSEKSYYHVTSARFYNVIANGFITTDNTVAFSNLYGFTDRLTWASSREAILSGPNNLYDYSVFSDFVPEYMYVGMRMGEIRVLENQGLITLDAFKKYFSSIQVNPDMVAKPELLQSDFSNFNRSKLLPPTIKHQKRSWTISFGNAQKLSVAEGQVITVPRIGSTTSWRNSVDGKTYQAGDRVKIYCGTHFTRID